MYNKEQINSVIEILKKNKTNYWTGIHCKKFEQEFSRYIGSKYAVSLSSGSVALELALKALNLKKGDEVIVTPRSFIISASCVLNLNLKPVFADVDNNGNLSIETIKKNYNNKVKAVIIVHLNGLSCDLDPILEFVNKKKIFLIEDCSQSHGAIYKDKKVGSFGHISTWSFCQDKIISTGGEGGMILTNDKSLWLKIWSLKDHGKNYYKAFNKTHKPGFKWLHENLGSNYRMTEIQAVIGRKQLKILDDQVKKRNLIANLYIRGLKDYYQKLNILQKPDYKCTTCPIKNKLKKCPNCSHAFYRLELFINIKKIKQHELIKKINDNKIFCSTGSCPEIYKENIFKRSKIYSKIKLSNAKILGNKTIMFPITPSKKLKKIKIEIKKIQKIFNQYI